MDVPADQFMAINPDPGRTYVRTVNLMNLSYSQLYREYMLPMHSMLYSGERGGGSRFTGSFFDITS
jgi:hypothetical protein